MNLLFFEDKNAPKTLRKKEEFTIPLDLLLCGCAVSGSAFFLLGILFGLFAGGI